METRPEFTVIAGANGAGKSRLSPYYLHCKSFDGDLLDLFDNITFVDGNSNYGEIVAIYIKKSAKHEITNQSYEWFNRFFAEAFDKLK